MTGDGVNDAPALRRAGIGVAMGVAGTEVTREAATMVFTDDDFATIVAAVREGRGIYDNIVKFTRFQLSTALGLVLMFLVASVAGIAGGVPVTAVQILFFTTADLTGAQWLVCALTGSAVLWVGEIVKLVVRRR